MTIALIAAVSRNGVIGDADKNSLPWDLRKYPKDILSFRKKTIGATVIMGRKTFESMGSRLLPKRKNLIISRNPNFKVDGADVLPNLDEALHFAHFGEQKMIDEGAPIPAVVPAILTAPIFIIGGASLYQEGLKHADKIYLTEIPEIVEGNNLVYFPFISSLQFKELEKEDIGDDLKVRTFEAIIQR